MIILYIIVFLGTIWFLSSITSKGKRGSGRSAPTYQTAQPSPVDIWWKNLKRTPLSAAESQRIAEKVLLFYDRWYRDSSMDHSWLCIAINANKVECRQMSRDYSSAPTPTYSFTHSLSCQADREELAGYILRAVRAIYPDTTLHLDGDALILSTN